MKEETLLLTTKAAASFMGVSMAAFRRIMSSQGVAPIDVGANLKKNYLRWSRAEVKRVVNVLQAEAQTAQDKRKRHKKTALPKVDLFDRPLEELYSELSESQPVQ